MLSLARGFSDLIVATFNGNWARTFLERDFYGLPDAVAGRTLSLCCQEMLVRKARFGNTGENAQARENPVSQTIGSSARGFASQHVCHISESLKPQAKEKLFNSKCKQLFFIWFRWFSLPFHVLQFRVNVNVIFSLLTKAYLPFCRLKTNFLERCWTKNKIKRFCSFNGIVFEVFVFALF